jgi:hypothetical protein
MTGPLIFLSPSSDFRANVEENGLLRKFVDRVAGVVARGRALVSLEANMFNMEPLQERKGFKRSKY